MSKTLHPQTLAIRGGKEQMQYREHNQALFLTSSLVSESAQQGTALFAREVKGLIYTRTANPMIATFEQRTSALEGVERSMVTSIGMSAIQASLFTFLKTGNHAVSNRSLFGAVTDFINNIVTKFDIRASYVSQTDLSEWWAAVKEDTKLLFPEAPSGPLNEVADLKALPEITHVASALLVVDNSFLSPVGQQPLKHGADIPVQLATKAIDGHGRMMGGVLSGLEELMAQVAMYYNSRGLAISSLNARALLSGVETLSVRMEKQFVGASEIARWLSEQSQIKAIYYSGLPGHSQTTLVARQQLGDGIVVGFEVDSKDAAWSLLNRVELFSKIASLGGVRPTITHPWTTTHGRISPKDKQAADVRPGLLRLAIDLEYPDDLIVDLQQAMA